MIEQSAREALAAEIAAAIRGESGGRVDLRDPVRAAIVIQLLEARDELSAQEQTLLDTVREQERRRREA